MPRKREFNPDAALRKAMNMFWQRGYFNTSITDLVSATGVSRHGLYEVFSSKHQLFIHSLELYNKTVIGQVFGGVETPQADLKDITQYFKTISDAPQPFRTQGCFMVNSSCDAAPTDDTIKNLVADFRQRLQNGFCKALNQAQSRQQIANNMNCEHAAQVMTALVHALAIMSRAGASSETLHTLIDATFSQTLNIPTNKTTR